MDNWIRKGNALIEKSKYEEAIVCFNSALEKVSCSREKSTILTKLGMCSTILDEDETALDFCKQALLLNPENEEAQLILHEVERKLNPSIHDQINSAMSKYLPENKIEDLRNVFDSLFLEKKTAMESSDLEYWYDMRGSIEYKIGDRDIALKYYREGAERFPESDYILYGYARELMRIGDYKNAKKTFQSINLDKIDLIYLLFIARFYYLMGYYEEGLDLMDYLFDYYDQLGNISSTYLNQQNIPLFEDVFAFKAVFAKLLNQPEIILEELHTAKENFKDYDFHRLELETNAFLTDDWKPIQEILEQARFDPLIEVLIKARESEPYDSAMEFLDSINKEALDSPWLYDVIILAKAEIAHKFESYNEENKYIKIFMQHQKNLFEPHHIFRFGFLSYQELLKKNFF